MGPLFFPLSLKSHLKRGLSSSTSSGGGGFALGEAAIHPQAWLRMAWTGRNMALFRLRRHHHCWRQAGTPTPKSLLHTGSSDGGQAAPGQPGSGVCAHRCWRAYVHVVQETVQ